MKRITGTLLSGLILPALLVASPGMAQDTLVGGALVTLNVGVGYSYDDDDDPENTLGTRLDLGVFSETRSQRLSFSVGTRAEISDGETALADSDGQFNYAIFNRYTEASIDLRYREVDVDDDFDPNAPGATSGSRETHSAALQLITGRTTRFGTQTVLSYEQIDFVDVTDPNLVNQITLGVDNSLRFSLSRRVELRAFGSWREETRDEAIEEIETRTRFGLGTTVLIDRAWTGSADLAWSEIETEIGAAVTTQDGLDGNLTLTRALSNGTLSFAYDREVTTADPIDSLSVARDMALANGAALSASVGLVAFDGDDIQPAFGLAYEQEILRGRTLSASLTQEGRVDDDDETTFLTQLAVRYRQELTPRSFFAASLSASAVDVVTGPSDDTERASVGLEYGHALTQDWALVARADHTRVFEGGMETDRDSSMSINLERSFSFRP